MLKSKKVLITGGTGSLGKGLLKRITGAKHIRVLSRSEASQIPLRREYPDVEFLLGDVADLYALDNAVRGMDVVIHAAAFKFLDLAETQTRQCVVTNVLGSLNLIQAVHNDGNVESCVGISTDKVCYARNAYGATKHIMEKLFREANRESETKFFCVRYGNVLGTTGSVMTIWENQKKEGKPITVTDKNMTRFFFTLDESIDLIEHALMKAKGGEVFVKRMKAHNMYDLAKEFSDKIKEVGARPGEKLFEILVADYEGEPHQSNEATHRVGEIDVI